MGMLSRPLQGKLYYLHPNKEIELESFNFVFTKLFSKILLNFKLKIRNRICTKMKQSLFLFCFVVIFHFKFDKIYIKLYIPMVKIQIGKMNIIIMIFYII